jgi:hypothetical protein
LGEFVVGCAVLGCHGGDLAGEAVTGRVPFRQGVPAAGGDADARAVGRAKPAFVHENANPGAPNNWPHDQTFSNVLRKLDPSEVEGSRWDPNSVMEYWFPAGLITQPAKYSGGLDPAGGLSAADKKWVKQWYPALKATTPTLKPFVSSPLALKAGQQVDYAIEPDATRNYQFSTFGASDTVMVLFENVDGEMRFVAGDDDSGADRNAQLTAKLFKGRHYVVRLRLYLAGASGETAVMYW